MFNTCLLIASWIKYKCLFLENVHSEPVKIAQKTLLYMRRSNILPFFCALMVAIVLELSKLGIKTLEKIKFIKGINSSDKALTAKRGTSVHDKNQI